MTMTFLPRENTENFGSAGNFESDTEATDGLKKRREKISLFAEKMRVPPLENYISRPRLDELFQNSLEKIGALLITGRAGTGKTALAAHFSKNYRQTVWYRVEAADSDWKIFSSYLFEGIKEKTLKKHNENVAQFTEKLFGKAVGRSKSTRLIVLDGIHNVLDAEWFEAFFTSALSSLSPKTHLIFLSRSKPALPLWRLRSKQVLTLIDEKMLAFDRFETEKVCRKRGVPAQKTDELLSDSFGRIGKIQALLDCEKN